jgi:DhnA family fructose-bisphosphate aldolase class Ia
LTTSSGALKKYYVISQEVIMNGRTLRLKKFIPDGERIIILPLDHGEFQGPRKGLIDFRQTLQEIDRGYDALLCAPGQFERNWDIFAARKSVTSIVRINWDSDYCFQWGYTKGYHGVVLSPAQAAAMGVDVVLASISIGSGDAAVDSANVEQFARLLAEARSVGIPIGGEIYPGIAGQVSDEAFHDLIYRSCRIVSELGADFIKTFYTGPQFGEVVESTPVPLIVLGADKVEEIQALRLAEKAMQAGARGVVFGRNVFEGARPNDFLAALGEIVRKGIPAAEAAKKYGFKTND